MKKILAILLLTGFIAGISSCNRDRCPNHMQHEFEKPANEEQV